VKSHKKIVLGDDITELFRRHPKSFRILNEFDHGRTGTTEKLAACENLIKYAAVRPNVHFK
jgi:hypothetical protein